MKGTFFLGADKTSKFEVRHAESAVRMCIFTMGRQARQMWLPL